MSEQTTAPVEEPQAPAVEPAPTPEPEAPVQDAKASADAELRRKLAEAERRANRLERQQKEADEKRAAEQGEWQKLAEQREQELNQEREQRTRVEREQRITRLASRLKFIDPQDAIFRVRGEDGDSEEAAIAALEQVAQQSPHLIVKDTPAVPEIGQVLSPSAPAAQGVQPPAGKAPLRTMADVEALSDPEFAERYAEVQAVLKNPQ